MKELKKQFKINSQIVTFLTVASLTNPSFAETQWRDLAQLSDGFDANATYMASCFACHSTGAAGAPKVQPGNQAAWTSRLEKGMDAVVQNTIVGINNMPPKGLCFTCTDADISALVLYMVENSK
jgi:cytochrome c5